VCTISPAAVNYYQTLSTLRFANRAKIVKTKPLLNEIKSDKTAIESYKKQIKMLEDELKNKNSNDQRNSAVDFYKDTPKDILEYIMKSNESLSNELVNYKELYQMEKERNEQIQLEIEKLKEAINNNNNMISTLMKSNSNVSQQAGSNLEANHNNSSYIPLVNENNRGSMKSINSSNINPYSPGRLSSKGVQDRFYSPLKEDTRGSYKSYISDNVKGGIGSPSGYQRNTYTTPQERGEPNEEEQQELLYAEGLINRINQSLPETDKRYASPWTEQSRKFSSSYKNEVTSLQNKYRDMIKDSYSKHFPRMATELFEDSFSDEKDDIIRKITQGAIFKDIRLMFQSNTYDHFENNIKTLKQTYEDKIDTLEKNMDYYKSYLENFYRKKIQNTRNAKIDDMDFMNRVESPIMMITSEHNEKLKLLRELYDSKLKELEQVSFVITN
jgi:hypothetical protein